MKYLESDVRVEAHGILEGVGYADIAGESADVDGLNAESMDISVNGGRSFGVLEDGVFVFFEAFSFVKETDPFGIINKGLHQRGPNGSSDG